MLTSMGGVEGAAVVDLFAGSGAMGIEALSRGATSAVFVDSDRRAVSAIRANLAVIDEPERSVVIQSDATRWAGGAGNAAVDVVFADPPYAWDGWEGLGAALATTTQLLVAETGGALELGPGWQTARSRRYGTTLVTVARPIYSQQRGKA